MHVNDELNDQQHFLCSDYWFTILQYLDSTSLHALSAVNKWLRNAILSEMFTPLYRPSVRVEFRACSELHPPVLSPGLQSVIRRAISDNRQALVEKLYPSEAHLFNKVAFELSFKDEPYKPMDAVVFITEKPQLINLKPMATHYFINRDAPIVVINVGSKAITKEAISNHFSNILVLNVLRQQRDQKQITHIEEQVFDFLRRKCQILRSVPYNRDEPYWQVYDRIIAMSSNQFCDLVNSLFDVYGMKPDLSLMLGMPISPLMHLLSFHQLDRSKQLQLIHKFYYDYVGGTEGMFSYRLTRSLPETMNILNKQTFRRFNKEIHAATGNRYEQVRVTMGHDKSSYVVKYWKLDMFHEPTCKAVVVTTTIPRNYYHRWHLHEEVICQWNAQKAKRRCVIS